MRGAGKRARPTQAPSQPIVAECEIFQQHVPQKKYCQNWRKLGVQFYNPDFGWKMI